MSNFLSICMVWEGCHLKIRDICMDLEPCFKVNNLVVIQLKNTKLGQMANLNMIFYMVCQFINWIKFATRPSPLLDFKVANGWDASPSQGYPQQYVAGTHLYT